MQFQLKGKGKSKFDQILERLDKIETNQANDHKLLTKVIELNNLKTK